MVNKDLPQIINTIIEATEMLGNELKSLRNDMTRLDTVHHDELHRICNEFEERIAILEGKI